MVTQNLAEAYHNSTNLHDYILSVFVPEPLFYTSSSLVPVKFISLIFFFTPVKKREIIHCFGA